LEREELEFYISAFAHKLLKLCMDLSEYKTRNKLNDLKVISLGLINITVSDLLVMMILNSVYLLILFLRMKITILKLLKTTNLF